MVIVHDLGSTFSVYLPPMCSRDRQLYLYVAIARLGFTIRSATVHSAYEGALREPATHPTRPAAGVAEGRGRALVQHARGLLC